MGRGLGHSAADWAVEAAGLQRVPLGNPLLAPAPSAGVWLIDGREMGSISPKTKQIITNQSRFESRPISGQVLGLLFNNGIPDEPPFNSVAIPGWSEVLR